MTLTNEQREWIVLQLARFLSPAMICTDFAVRFPNVRCTEVDVIALDPKQSIVAPELLSLFRAERERVLTDPEATVFTKRQARQAARDQLAQFYFRTRRPEEARKVLNEMMDEENKGVSKIALTNPEGDGAPTFTFVLDRPKTDANT